MSAIARKILITGSSRGIGAQIARDAFIKGYKVILHGRTDSDALRTLKQELNCDALTFDVRDWVAAESAIETLDRLDVLINSAGINISAPLDDLSLEDWQNVYSVNVFGLAGVTNACRKLLDQSNSARIVNIGSVKGYYASTGRAAYASSKAAVSSLTTAMAKEFAPNILVNCVAPGFVATDMTEQTMSPRIESQISSSLIGRLAAVEEISSAVMYFCSNDSSFVTGQTLLVDGGFSIKKG